MRIMGANTWAAAAACVMMIGAAWSAEELKRADLVGKWQCTFVSGKEGEDVSKYELEIRADGSASLSGQKEPGSWILAKTEEGKVLLLLQDGGSSFMTSVVELKDGEMSWKPFTQSKETKLLQASEKPAYRFKKLEQ